MKDKIKEVLLKEDNFLITAHLNPDGDAIGSMCAVGFLLQKLNKNFVFYNQSPFPQKFSWLSLPSPWSQELPSNKPNWLIILDSGDSLRIGEDLQPWLKDIPSINIDHHLSNPLFGTLNWVNPQASSVGEMIAELCADLNIKLEDKLAEALYLAILSDTGSFSYGNTTSRAHYWAGEMIANGLDVGKINALLNQNLTLNKLKLMARVLGSTELKEKGQIALIKITQKMFTETSTSIEDCEGFINYIRNLQGVKIAASLREEKDQTIKFSLRSYGDINVQKIAQELKGGGHKNAAGGTMPGPLEKAEEILLTTIKKNLTI